VQVRPGYKLPSAPLRALSLAWIGQLAPVLVAVVSDQRISGGGRSHGRAEAKHTTTQGSNERPRSPYFFYLFFSSSSGFLITPRTPPNYPTWGPAFPNSPTPRTPPTTQLNGRTMLLVLCALPFSCLAAPWRHSTRTICFTTPVFFRGSALRSQSSKCCSTQQPTGERAWIPLTRLSAQC
jgi:hypothetical protein